MPFFCCCCCCICRIVHLGPLHGPACMILLRPQALHCGDVTENLHEFKIIIGRAIFGLGCSWRCSVDSFIDVSIIIQSMGKCFMYCGGIFHSNATNSLWEKLAAWLSSGTISNSLNTSMQGMFTTSPSRRVDAVLTSFSGRAPSQTFFLEKLQKSQQ